MAAMSRTDIFIFWALSCFAGLTVVAGKLGYMLFQMGEQPPDDPAAAVIWKRKRRWLALSELMALPSFATIAITATVYLHLPPITSVLISMALGGLGFGFVLHAVQFLARRQLKLEGMK